MRSHGLTRSIDQPVDYVTDDRRDTHEDRLLLEDGGAILFEDGSELLKE
jgi:hypothetical protein